MKTLQTEKMVKIKIKMKIYRLKKRSMKTNYHIWRNILKTDYNPISKEQDVQIWEDQEEIETP